MPKEDQDQIFTFTITIVSVKMKVKFPCKMAIEQTGRTLTNEVPPNQEGKFIFNQEIRLRQESQKLFSELNISLVTQKGARYVSGMVKLYHSQLLRSEGDRLVITLSKCLDTEAFCQMRVEKVMRQGGGRKRTLTTLPQKQQKLISPRHNDEVNHLTNDFRSPKKPELNHVPFDSRSQTYFPVTANLKLNRGDEDLRMRDYMSPTAYPLTHRRQNPSPKGRSRPMNSKNKYMQFNNSEYERQKMLEAEVYKQNYQKLKQKFLKEAQTSKNEMSKRMILQNNENNYKLQIVKLKLKNEQLQKILIDKNSRLKELSAALATMQGRESEINMLREELANKEHAIRIMDDTIVSLSKQNDDLRMNGKESTYQLEQKLIMLENQLEMSAAKAATKRQELERQLKNVNDTLQHKELELAKKNDMLEKQKHNVNQLQKTIQNRMFQFDSHLQNQRNSSKQKAEELKGKIEEVNQLLGKVNSEKNQLTAEVDKYKGLLLKNQYEFKLFQQEMNTLRAELEELRPIRDKYNDIIKELRSVSEQKVVLEKTHEKYVLSKENSFEDVTKEYKKETEYNKKTIKELQQKSKQLSSKLFESQAQLELVKGSLQKSKKTNENLSKEVSELKDKEKALKKGLKVKEQQFEDSKKELLRFKQKNQNLLESTKVEFSKTRQELSKTKIDLQSQMVKNQQLVQTNSDLNMQLARMKMAQQFSDEKYEKLTQSAQEKYYQFQKIIKEHQSVIDLLQEKIRSQKDNQKDFYGKLQKCDYEITMVVDKNNKIVKEIKSLQEKNKQLEIAIKSKQNQLLDALKKITDTEAKAYSAEEQAKELKDQLQFSNNQLEKTKKIIEIVQRDYEKAKTDIIAYCQKLTQREKELDEKYTENKRQQDNISDLELRQTNLKKEYEKFKDSVSEALNNSFTQVVQAFSMQKDHVTVSGNFSNPELQSMAIKRGINDLNNQLVNAISSAGKQSKGQINKLNERIRVLERDLDMVRTEMERSQDSSRKQISEKTKYIEQLEDLLRNLKNEKGENQVQTNIHIEQLEIQLKHYQQECSILQANKNQLEFSIKSLRMQVERISDEYDQKFYKLINEKQELQQKLEYQYNNTEVVEKKVHELEVELMNINSVVIAEKEQNYKKDQKIAEQQQQKQGLQGDISALKGKIKENEEKYNELQIQFVTLKEVKEKYEVMLTEEQTKLKDVRSFNNNILKEKQEIIKKELQKNLEITQLENTITDIRHQLQQSQELKEKYKNSLEEVKETAKRSSGQMKDLENGFSQEKVKYNELRQKLREKEQLLTEAKEELLALNKKNEEEKQKNKAALEQFKEENDMLMKQLETITLQSSETIRSLESQIAKESQSLQTSKDEIGQLQEALFVERQNNSSMHESINKLKYELQDLRKRIEQMQKQNDVMAEQNREKDEHMFELGGKLFEYQTRMRELQQEKQRQLQELNNSMNVKYDEDYQQINQKIELIEKEKQYLKEKLNEKEQEVTKKTEELKLREIQENQIKKSFEEKIKKMEDQKLILFSDKNKQLAKILEENKNQFETLRSKDTELRKIAHQLEISRSTIVKLESKIKEMQNDRSSQIKAYQTEIQNLRKKELGFKSYKDTVKSNQWNCEREIRKLIQAFIKKILENGGKQVGNQSLISSIKGMEEGMLNAISIVGKEQQ